jgi:aldehyde:ferredoxin oxidoreductase
MPGLPQTKALSAITGWRITMGALKDIGERGFNLERMFNLRMGLTAMDDALPRRLTHEPQAPDDPKSVVPLEAMKKEYYAIRGWDASSGAPGDKKKKQLGLE